MRFTNMLANISISPGQHECTLKQPARRPPRQGSGIGHRLALPLFVTRIGNEGHGWGKVRGESLRDKGKKWEPDRKSCRACRCRFISGAIERGFGFDKKPEAQYAALPQSN